jgi:hypothetical protein
LEAPAVTVYDDPASGTHQLQVWAVGTDGHLYNHYYDGAWHWRDFGTDGVPLIDPAVTVYDDPVSGEHQLQVWANGGDVTNSHLYNLWYDGRGNWSWNDFGGPGAYLGAPAVMPYFDPASKEYQLQVWASGNDGHLYNLWYDGQGNWNWIDFGNDTQGLYAPAVTVYDDPVSGEHQLQVWANGSDVNEVDGHLYNLWYDGQGHWNWADHGSPGFGYNPGANGGRSPDGGSVATEPSTAHAARTGSVASFGSTSPNATDLVFIAHSRAGQMAESLGWLEASEVDPLADRVSSL